MSTFYTVAMGESNTMTNSRCLNMNDSAFTSAMGASTTYQFADVKAFSTERAMIVFLATKTSGQKSVLILIDADFTTNDLDTIEL